MKEKNFNYTSLYLYDRDLVDELEQDFRSSDIRSKSQYLTHLIGLGLQVRKNGNTDYKMITFITSISAETSSTSRGEYCISKAGLHMATSLFADRLAEYGIPVNEIRPGIIATDMTAGVQEKYDRLIDGGLLPVKRWGQPEDIAEAVWTLCSGSFPYMTGQAINIDGGFHIRRL